MNTSGVGTYVARLPHYLREFLESSPSGGEGVNRWTIQAANRLHRCHTEVPEAVMEDILEHYAGRSLKPGEAARAIRASHPDNPRTHSAPDSPKWPQRNLYEIERIALENPGIPGLHGCSAVEGDSVDAEQAVDLLFPGNPLLCVGMRPDHCDTLPRVEWRGFLRGHQLIVPSPMTAVSGRTQDGRAAPRTLSNTGPRRFLVVEFDFRERDSEGVDTLTGPLIRKLRERERTVADLCASLHLHLANYWPLAMVVHSGGKSHHGWYPCARRSEEDVRKFMRFAVSLGADPATWTRCQFVRLPSGLRCPGNVRQRIEFFNPSALSTNLP